MDVPNQDVITRDNVSIKVNAVVYFRVVDPLKAILEVEDYMAQAQKGLGRGLEALLGGFHEERSGQDILTVALEAIRANPEQPRRVFSSQALEELAASIREQGLLQPVLVRPVTGAGTADYEIVAGERRWRAARLAGLREIPVLVREVDDAQSLSLALIENLQREDLNPVEQASGLQLLQTRCGMTWTASLPSPTTWWCSTRAKCSSKAASIG